MITGLTLRGAPIPSSALDRPDPTPASATPTPQRTIHEGDALAWLAARGELAGCSLVTSLPDVSELAMDLAAWRAWFIAAAEAVLRACPLDGAVIFYQTDIKHAGVWVDKGHLVQIAADNCGAPLWWHKIACRKPAGTITFGRPAYAHLLCFGREPLGEPDGAADVFDTGAMTWSRAMGVQACVVACEFIRRRTPSRVVVDPFCGRGTVLAVANALGLGAVGVELSPRRCRNARNLQIDPRRPAP